VSSDPQVLSVAPMYGCAVEDQRAETPALPAPLMVAPPAPIRPPPPPPAPAAVAAPARAAGPPPETADAAIVPDATLADLDLVKLADYLSLIQEASGSEVPFHLALEQTLADRQVTRAVAGAPRPTLAGLLMFGKEPQAFEPGLVVVFRNHYADPAGDAAPADADAHVFDGAIPEIVENVTAYALATVRKNRLTEGVRRHDTREYPREAVREAICNALGHRDYRPAARALPVEVRLYADRLEIESPGGLAEPVTEANLESARATRNPALLQLLADLRLVANRGAGVRTMLAAMRGATLEPPRWQPRDDSLRVTLHNHRLMDPLTLAWLNGLHDVSLNAEQRAGLAYLRHNAEMSSVEYARLNQVNSGVAERDLRALALTRLVAPRVEEGRTVYTLAAPPDAPESAPPPGA
jgi:ATP-dependent DNA helicase RecG